MDKKVKYTKTEIAQTMDSLMEIFDLVRLVDGSACTQLTLEMTESEPKLCQSPYKCYTVWDKDHKCRNCISAKALKKKARMTKYEFINEDIYYVVAKYIELDSEGYVLEIVSDVSDEILLGAYGKDEFIDKIEKYNLQMYTDATTGAFNRNYYEEQVIRLSEDVGFAIVDADLFKSVNDTYGHEAGDAALKMIVDVVKTHIRKTDSIIRYGGDEFIMIVHDIDAGAFQEKLENIVAAVAESRFSEYSDMKVTISAGAVWTDRVRKVDEIFNNADKALYRAKKKRNSYVLEVVQ